MTRFVREEWSIWTLCVILGIVALALGIALWARIRERRGDWGPGLVGVSRQPGFSPADLRRGIERSTVEDPRERWLLGLAAPFVEQAGLMHERWSLVPAFCGDEWRRRLFDVANPWGAVRAKDWRQRAAVLEAELLALTAARAGLGEAGAASPDPRPWLAANLAMQLRLGVAARHVSAPRARARLEAAAAPLRADYRDWLGYGNAIIEAAEQLRFGSAVDLRADLRTLYAPDGPWAEVEWRSGL